jgi:hypothetical protein
MDPNKTEPTLPVILTLFVGGVGLVLLTCLGLKGHQLRFAHGAIVISRLDHPILYWGYEGLCLVVGAFFVVLSVRQMRAFFLWQRDFERQAVDEFVRRKRNPKQEAGNKNRAP